MKIPIHFLLGLALYFNTWIDNEKYLFYTVSGVLLSQSSVAKTKPSVDDVIKSSFTGVSTIEPKQIILTKKQFSQVQSRAKAAVRTKIYRYYDIKSKTKRLGYAVLISRKVRRRRQQYSMHLITPVP